MEEVKNRYDELLRQGLSFVLWLALVLGGLGFASVFAVALLVGGIYLIVTGHLTGGSAPSVRLCAALCRGDDSLRVKASCRIVDKAGFAGSTGKVK